MISNDAPVKTQIKRQKFIGAIDHAVAVLRCLSEASEPLGVNEIARRVGLNKASVSRIAATLERSSLVRRDADTGRMMLGFGLVVLASPILADLHIRDAVRPILARLATDCEETVSYSIWDGRCAVVLEQVVGRNPVQAFSVPGSRHPGHATSAGKMLLSLENEEAIDAYCATPLSALSSFTITDPDKLRRELAITRSRGYALNDGELQDDVGAVSSVVRARDGLPVGTITATVPSYRFIGERRLRTIDLVTRAARELSDRLGYSPASKMK